MRRGVVTRPLGSVPGWVTGLLAVALAAQILLHGWRPGPTAAARDLPAPPAERWLQAASLGEPVALARWLMLWLQAFDNQPGISIPFRQLDYSRVRQWLDRILDLDPRADYPLLAASRLYAEVPDPPRQRLMMDFVYRRFLEDPDHRWRWLAHVSILARHRLHDPDLALAYARAITEHATGPSVPFWARDMSFLLLEDRGEIDAARVIVGGLLDGGLITDPHELRFLHRKLRDLEPR